MQTTDQKYARALEGVDRFWKWAEKEDLSKELVYDLLSEGTDPEPPFHKVLTWFDLFTPDGVKVHGTARGNVTAQELGRVLKVTAEVTSKLMEDGWQSADRMPRTSEAVAETRTATEGGFSGEGTRRIPVDEIIKKINDNGNLEYLVKGHPWKQFGVRAWPDSGNIERLAGLIDLDAWEGGPKTFAANELFAIVELKEDGKPRRVTDWSGPKIVPDSLDDVDEIPF